MSRPVAEGPVAAAPRWWQRPEWRGLVPFLLAAAVIGVAAVLTDWTRSGYVLAGGIGGAVGVAEVSARYRDAPAASLMTFPGVLYVLINAGASVLCLALLDVFLDPVAAGAFKERLTRTMAAGFGAMAVFRSSIFTARIGGSDIGIGPAGFLKIILDSVDHACDRLRGPSRGAAVARIMQDVSFEKAHASLPTVAFRMLLNVPEGAVNTISLEVNQLKQGALPDAHKAVALGLALLPLVGDKVLERAVAMLGPAIQRDRKLTIQSLDIIILLQRIDADPHFELVAAACQTMVGEPSQADVDYIDTVRRKVSQDFGAMALASRRLLFASLLVSRFGESVVREALKLLPDPAPA